jgi:hypothetical protein
VCGSYRVHCSDEKALFSKSYHSIARTTVGDGEWILTIHIEFERKKTVVARDGKMQGQGALSSEILPVYPKLTLRSHTHYNECTHVIMIPWPTPTTFSFPPLVFLPVFRLLQPRALRRAIDGTLGRAAEGPCMCLPSAESSRLRGEKNIFPAGVLWLRGTGWRAVPVKDRLRFKSSRL